MNISCDVIMDLIPLVKDNVASADSVDIVTEHLKSCEKCRREFEDPVLPMNPDLDDQRVAYSIKKKLYFAVSALLLIGALIGMAINKNSQLNAVPALIIVFGIAFVGLGIFKFKIKGDRNVERFFIGRAIGTLIVFAGLGIYLLLKYGLHLF